ncbi:cytochrome P450 [Wolfiporia cocos MD-104 SS10]|uniref:Cytochrome P450 n=1 Tax=Wolfiporia cocos (strain MD-104) TaxID=742152 RepID=A0A2H3JM83_WOLCO|nr:cytochrome P450 [Wolfiporia cocos MD-104 SS10]
MALQLHVTAAIFAIVLAVILWHYDDRQNHVKGKKLPPGPKSLVFIGNSHQLSPTYMQKQLTEWKLKYGDIIYARLFQKPVIILNSVQSAQDLLDKKSSIYSDRPHTILYDQILGWVADMAFMQYGERWKKHRKWAQSAYNDKTTLKTYRPVRTREVYALLSGFLNTPDKFHTHIKRYVAALIMETAYGHTITSADDDYVRMADEALVATTEAGIPGATVIDIFPILRYIPPWVPGASFMRHAIKARPLVEAAADIPYLNVKQSMASGTAKPSFVLSLLRDSITAGKMTKEHEDDIKGLAAVLYGGKALHTSSVLLTFMLVMTLFPYALQKAQEELDRVVGRHRLPDLEDRESLPYLDSLIKEVYRWDCPLPLAIPHRVMEDDEYSGYYIPKGSMVIPNIWSLFMMKDPTMFADPERFWPERFLEMSASEAQQKNPGNFVFGFGRRICPGRHFADENIWLAVACTASLFNIQKARDIHGREIIPDPVFNSGVVSHPKHFDCEIRPRSEDAVKLLFGYTNSLL